MKWKCTLVAAALLITINTPANAKDIAQKEVLVSEQLYGTTVSFSANRQIGRSSITISGPAGFQAQKSSKFGLTALDLSDYGNLPDGLYNYEVVVSTGKLMLIQDTMNNGRGENNSHYARKGIIHSGHFRVKGGSIQKFRKIKEVSATTDF